MGHLCCLGPGTVTLSGVSGISSSDLGLLALLTGVRSWSSPEVWLAGGAGCTYRGGPNSYEGTIRAVANGGGGTGGTLFVFLADGSNKEVSDSFQCAVYDL
jgi:hypothetical protein